MNLLIDLVPNEVEISGKMYEINSDFRTSILFEQLMLDEDIKEEYKFIQALQLYFPKLPAIGLFEEAFKKIIWFYSCDKETEETKVKRGKNTSSKQIYDWDYDDEYIYAAFLDQYNIDLQEIEHLHWWKFKAMFKSLKETNKIVEIMKYRSINLSEIEDKKEKKFYKKMQETFALPNKVNKSEKEKLRAIEDALLKDGVLNLENL